MKRLTWANAICGTTACRDVAMMIRAPAHPRLSPWSMAAAWARHELALWVRSVIASRTRAPARPRQGRAPFPTVGATHTWPRIIGERLAREMIFCARRFFREGGSAEEIGLI